MLRRLYRILRRVIFFALFTLIVVVSAGMLSLYLYGDKIKQQIIRNFNESINTPVTVDGIDIDATSNFPFVTISMNDVVVKESYKFSEKDLLTAASVEFMLNPLNLVRGDYSVYSVVVNEGNMDLMVNRRGEINYRIFKESGTDGASADFSVDRFVFKDIKFTWTDITLRQYIDLHTPGLEASLVKRDTSYIIELEGNAEVFDFSISGTSYLKGRTFYTRAGVEYLPNSGKVMIGDALVEINGSDFLLNGDYDPSNRGMTHLLLEGKNTTIKTLISLLPDDIASKLSQYQSEGDVYFDLELNGPLNSDETPSISSHFGISNATISYPETGQRITDTFLQGMYVSNSMDDLQSARLELKDIRASFDGRGVQGDFIMENFADKHVTLSLKGYFDLNSLLDFYPQSVLYDVKGAVNLDVNFKGRLNDLESLSTISRINSDGSINMDAVDFSVEGFTRSFTGFNGTLTFDRNTLAFRSLAGSYGQSQFIFSGEVSNIFSYLFLDDQSLKLNASLESDFIDMDELLAAREGEKSGEYSLSFPPDLDLEFNCNVKKIHFDRFSGEELKGNLKIRDQLAMLQKIEFREIGGTVRLEGLIDTKGETVDVLTRFTTDGIHIDSLFYVFYDFGQDFLVSDHLKGKVRSDVNAEMQLTRKLEFIPQSLIADIQLNIDGGQLNQFEPIQELSTYIPDDSLHYLRFSELRNDIHVEDRVIIIPKMEVRSNVTDITIGGTYTFDHHLNFKIVAPLVHSRRIDKDEAFGAIEDDGGGSPKIHLLMTGTTDDYIVALDRSAMKDQLVTGLKKEVEELKDAFRKKQKEKKKKLVLEEDEFFDWEDH